MSRQIEELENYEFIDPIVIPPGKIAQRREEFLRLVEKSARIVDQNEYAQAGLGPDSHFGAGTLTICYLPSSRSKILEAQIYINRDEFTLDGQDYSDLIPIVVRHEAFELWMYAKSGWSLFPTEIPENHARWIGHRLAVLEQYRLAFATGQAERFLNFFQEKVKELPPDLRDYLSAEQDWAYYSLRAKLRKKRTR